MQGLAKRGLLKEFDYLSTVSDGGHFENLGLYEMVRRRCKLIVVCDAGADPAFSFEDLDNAIRKIRIDLGISIDFGGKIPIESRKDASELPQTENLLYFDVARIKYSEKDGNGSDGKPVKDGILIYIKPTFYGREPTDVRQYALTCESFPHETTADQFFTESQFESYRALGEFIVGDTLTCIENAPPNNKQRRRAPPFA